MAITPRQRALLSNEHINQLPEHEKATLLRTKGVVNRTALTRSLKAYFEACLIDDKGMAPAFTMDEFTDSLADALFQMGKQRQLGVAVLQTLVHDLQDRINQSLSE